MAEYPFQMVGKPVLKFFIITIGLMFMLATNAFVSLNEKHEDTAQNSDVKTSKNAWKMPAFNLQGLDGRYHRLKEWQGKVIVLNFWASWCAPCQYEISDLIRYQKNLSDKGLQIVSLGLDEERMLRNVHRSLEINYPVLILNPESSETETILEQWGNQQRMIPYNVVIDRSGDIKYIHRGQLDEESFQEYILPLL